MTNQDWLWKLKRVGTHDGKGRYRSSTGRFSAYWSGRDGARDVWLLRDFDSGKFYRCDSLDEAREQAKSLAESK